MQALTVPAPRCGNVPLNPIWTSSHKSQRRRRSHSRDTPNDVHPFMPAQNCVAADILATQTEITNYRG
jgi:hypothetical protein